MRFFTILSAVFLVATLQGARIKDIATVQGLRDNQLQSIGLVTGLANTGDQDLEMTNQAIQNMMREYGLNVNLDDIESETSAIVMVTAKIGAFAKAGDNIDVTVAALGDAKSLQGGVLLQTPIYAANGELYAVAQGPVSVGGFIGGDTGGATVQKNHPTVGVISGGAIMEQSIATMMTHMASLDLKLFNPDFTTSVRMADAINRIFPGSSQSVDASTVNVIVPMTYQGQTPNFLAALEAIEVRPDVSARVVINERTGTIVATESVRISPVAVSYGALTIKVANNPVISQPNALAGGETVVANQQQTDVEEQAGGFRVLPDPQLENPTIQDLADGLNKLGVTTRDMINILHTLKASGALHAELKVE